MSLKTFNDKGLVDQFDTIIVGGGNHLLLKPGLALDADGDLLANLTAAAKWT
ncbi:MAG: hypothetical protein P8Y12_03135 [Gammaproteobacteria bacterium]